MVVEELTKQLKDNSLVICADEQGNYVTEKSRLDNGMADNNRYASAKHKKNRLKEVLPV